MTNDPKEPGPVEPWSLKVDPKEPGPVEPWLTRLDSDSALVAPW